MPVVEISMAKRTLEQKRAVAKRVTDVLVEELNVDPGAITILFYELQKEDIAKKGCLLSES